MGTDIHSYVIVKKRVYKQTENENHQRQWVVDGYEWKLVNLWEKNPYSNPDADNAFDRQDIRPASCHSCRNYMLFGVLAGVRSMEYDPIDYPRGLPSGCPQELRDYIDSWGNDAHDISWYSLAELNKAVKDKKKYPKHYTWTDVDGVTQVDNLECGPHYALKEFRNGVRLFADLESWCNDPEDVRVVFFFDS